MSRVMGYMYALSNDNSCPQIFTSIFIHFNQRHPFLFICRENIWCGLQNAFLPKLDGNFGYIIFGWKIFDISRMRACVCKVLFPQIGRQIFDKNIWQIFDIEKYLTLAQDAGLCGVFAKYSSLKLDGKYGKALGARRVKVNPIHQYRLHISWKTTSLQNQHVSAWPTNFQGKVLKMLQHLKTDKKTTHSFKMTWTKANLSQVDNLVHWYNFWKLLATSGLEQPSKWKIWNRRDTWVASSARLKGMLGGRRGGLISPSLPLSHIFRLFSIVMYIITTSMSNFGYFWPWTAIKMKYIKLEV